MAGVSYNQGAGSDVAPTVSAPDDYEHIQASPNAFGAAIAGGAEKLGAGLLQANQFYNASAADQATNNLVDQGTTLLHGDPNKVNPDGTHDTGFFGKQGQDMMDAYGAAHQQLQDLVRNHRENLPSGQAQLEYDRNSRRWMQIQEAEMGRAYDGAQKTWMINNNTVSGKQALDDISRSATDDKAFGGYLDNLKTAYAKTAQVHGLGDAGNQEAVRNATRDAWKVRLESLSLTDPARAEKLAVENQGLLGADEGPALITKYKKAAETADVRGGVGEAIAANIGKSTSELAGSVPGGKVGNPDAPTDPNATYASWPKGAVAYNPKTGKALFPATTNADGSPAPPGATSGADVARDNAAGTADIARREAGANFEAAKTEMNLTPQEQALYQRHLTNLSGPGGVDNADGSRSTLLQTTIEANGKTYNIPTVWGGKILSGQEAIAKAKAEGLDKFPSYPDEATAEARYQQMHAYMEKDTGSFLRARNAPATTPAGYDPDSYHRRTVGIELGNQPLTTTNASGHMGPVQASRDWWNEFGAGGSPFNLNDSIAALDRETARNQPVLTGVLGREPGGAELYLAHQQGIGGAAALLARPGANVIDALAPAYRGNRASAMQAVLANGGNVNMTAGQFSQMWTDRYNGAHPSAMGRTLGAGQTMTLPAEASGSAAAGAPSTLEGAPAGIQPATYTPTAEAAKPLDAPPEPETPEEKLERLTLAKDATLAYALGHHPEWNDAQQREAERQINLEFTRFTIATQMDAHTHKVQKDALGGKIASYMLDGRFDLALDVAHDRTNAYTSQERLALQELIEKKSGMPDPATLGPEYHKIMANVAAEPGSPDRIGVGDNLKILQAMNRGEITAKGAVQAMDWAARVQKSTDQLGVTERINGAIRTQADDIVHEYDIGEYKVRDPNGKAAVEKYTNAIYAAANQWRDSGKDWKDFPWFDPDYSKQQMLLLYSRRQRDQAKYDNEARANPTIDVIKPAPTGTDASAWSKIMATPPIIDNGQTIVHKNVWSDVVGDLLSHPDADHIAAFNASEIGKAYGTDAETLIQGLTGRSPDVQRGSGAPTPGIAPPRARTEQERKMLDVGGALRGLLHAGEAHPLTETPAQRALRYGVGDKP